MSASCTRYVPVSYDQFMTGTFTPTCYCDQNERTMFVILETSQIAELTIGRSEWSKKLLVEIQSQFEDFCYRFGYSEIKIIRRRYDGAPV